MLKAVTAPAQSSSTPTTRPLPTSNSKPVKVTPVYKEYPQTISLQSVAEASAGDASIKEENEEFTQAKFDQAWKEYAKTEAKQRPRLSSLLLSQIPQKPDEGLLFRLIVGSQTVKEYLYKNVHNSLEGYLRANLHNTHIDLRFEVDGEMEAETSGMPYTSKEKYLFMLEKNPNLQILRDIFDLETD